MFKFLRVKLLNKKWLNACLLLGIVLLVASVCCNPMFKHGSLDMMLSEKFDEYIEENNEYSAVIGRNGSCDMEKYGDVEAVLERISTYEDKWMDYLDIDKETSQTRLMLDATFANTNLGGLNKAIDISYIDDMEEHIEILFGEGLDTVLDDGTYPCIMTRQDMDNLNLSVGEVIDYADTTNASGDTLKFTIVGVFKESSSSDIFWYTTPAEIEKNIYVSADVFNEVANDYTFYTIYYFHNVMLDYSQITHSNASDIHYYAKQFTELDSQVFYNFEETLTSYESDASSITIILWVLELPVFVLVIAFIYMVSGQIIEMEDGEIAMLKSRGTGTAQILKIYLGQATILSCIGIVIGIPLGYLLCKIAAGCTSFLSFGQQSTEFYIFDLWMILYSVIAAAVAVLFMTLPVLKYTGNSIVEQKSKRNKTNDKPVWEKCFLDVIFTAVSIYLLYNYNKQRDSIAIDILSGTNPDPLIFLDSSLFIFAIGLLILRIIKYIIRLIYFIGRKHWPPAVYASFLQITRTSRKQGFISVFLVMTIAMGLFNSVMARTINQNNKERIEYNVGTDMIVNESWPLGKYTDSDKQVHWYYTENDYGRYSNLVDDNLADSVTKVLYDDEVTVNIGGNSYNNNVMMGINTKEFGETAELKSGINDEHWYNYLNELAQVTNGVIISSNMAEDGGLEVGDTISITRYNPIETKHTEEIATVQLSICAIVDAFPGYEQYTYSLDEEGNTVETEKYLVVTNYAYMVSAFGQTPYQVWVNMKDGVSCDDIIDYLTDEDVNIESYTAVTEEVDDMQQSPMVLITNGLFSLSFVISIVLCLVGFLIYWITSIKQRELLFGIYRAMGMSMHEINTMLINEQIFSSFLASLSGYGVGALATYLFVKLIAVVYLPESHNIAIGLAVNVFDIIKLTVVIIAMFIICFAVIRTILKKMNITQALKLGED